MSFRQLVAGTSVLFAILVTPSAGLSQQADVIRGRVTGPDSLPVENVSVLATSIPGGINRTTTTNRDGRFMIVFPNGEGDYMLTFTAIGFAPKRFELKRIADEDILVADARLQPVGAVLDAVTVTGQRDRPARDDPTPDIGGSEQAVTNAAVPADLMGDLAAMAASLPGVQLVPGENGDPNGFSVLGLDADQNNTTLNGMQFGGSTLPRDAAVSSALITSPYDVARGGFSGAQMSLRTRSGTNFVLRGMSLNADAPEMQWSDDAAESLGQEYSSLSLGGTVAGPIVFDKAFYNGAWQLGRRANDLEMLSMANDVGLEAAGVAPDSVAEFLRILQSQQVPTFARPVLDDRRADQGSVFGSFDFAPPSSSSGQALNLSFNGSWNRQAPVSALATELPSHTGERTSWRGGVQARHTTYFGFGMLSETSVGVSGSRTWSEPFLALPAGRVRVNSVFDDGSSGVQTLSFGGNQSLNSDQTTTTAGFLNQLSWFTPGNRHRIKLTSELRRDAAGQEMASNQLGTFTFNSLGDLETGRPASFTRQLAPRERDLTQWIAALSLGDSYRRTDRLQIQYGLRLDANRYTDVPALNPEVASAFGVRNDRVPNRVYLSPRVGFSWSYGTAAQIAGFEGAMRGPRAVVRGGIGLFQNLPNTNRIGSAIDNTGLASAARQITCVGTATPVPDWDAYAADPSLIPTECADSSGFANAAPNVTLFARDWRAPRSLRSNLQWSGPVMANRFRATVDATWSLNLDQSSPVDLNFNPQMRFTLPDEDDRPVFVPTTSIVTGTGQVAARDARLVPRFARVNEQRSDLRSESRQLTFRLAPSRFSTGFSWNVAYVLSDLREQFRGFTSTAGNPLDIASGRSPRDSRHQINYNLAYNFFDFVRVSWFGSFRSGTPFTPMVASDINGDGYANDRAFVFNPATAADPALSAAMLSLLANGPSLARTCLARQLGAIASRHSCQGPWSSTATMSISFNPMKVRMPRRATISFQLSNPLGAADLLMHGSSNLRGWGQPAAPDQALLYVRGFDPATQRYTYEVNERFGATNPAVGAMRAPVTLTAMMRFDVGPTRERQMLTQQLDRGRRRAGEKTPPMMLRAMYGNGGIPNPMATILRQQDTLQLTGPQADSIAVMNRRYTIRINEIWSPVTKYFVELPDRYDPDEAYGRYLEARKATVDLLIALAPAVKRLLTPDQRRRLPPFVASYLEPRYLASIRSGTAGFTGGTMFPGDATIAGGAIMLPAGGATRIEIRHD